MKKLILILLLFPFLSFGQGTKTINGKLIVTDSITGETLRGVDLSSVSNGKRPVNSNAIGKLENQPNQIIVSSVSDFPDPVAGVITLEEATTYTIVAPIVLSDRLVLPKTGKINSLGGSLQVLIYTGSGTLFTADSIDVYSIVDLTIVGNASATLFDIRAVPGTFPGIFVISGEIFQGFGDLGEIQKASLGMTNVAFINFDDGIVLDSMQTVLMTGNVFNNTLTAPSATPMVTLSGKNDLYQISSNLFNTSLGEFVFDIEATIEINEAIVANNAFRNGSAQFLTATSPSVNDIRFNYQNNGDAEDSDQSSFLSLSASAAETVVPGVFEKVAGTYAISIANRFTHSGGTLTYIGKKKMTFMVVASVSITTSNNNRTVDLRLALNGTSITASNQRQKVATGADIGTMAIAFQIELETGDTIELQYTTVSTATDITAEFLNFSIQ